MRRLTIALTKISDSKLCSALALEYLGKRISKYKQRRTRFVPEDIEQRLSEKHEYSVKDRIFMAWFYFVETKIWPDVHCAPVFELKWPVIQVGQKVLATACIAPISKDDYYRILRYMICDRVDKDNSFFQGARHFIAAYKRKMLFGVFCNVQMTGYLVCNTETIKRSKNVGSIQLRARPCDKYFRIQYLEIFPPYQKHGLGSTAIALIRKIATQDWECTHIILEPTPYATDFYRKIGFKIEKVHESKEASNDSLSETSSDSDGSDDSNNSDDSDDSSSEDEYDLQATLSLR
jgi:ribosomal protein S18 acetylase RimI-like enzyme